MSGRDDAVQYDVGFVVEMRKPHPCGHNEWRVLRIGMDFRLKCNGCGRTVMLPRRRFEKQVRRIISRPPQRDGT